MSFPIFRYGFALAPLALLSGCGMVVMDPPGDVASQQADLIIVATLLMLIVIIPVIFLTFFFAWRYRKGNTEAIHDPEWDHSTKLELIIWGVPLLIIIALGLITWVATHKLDPYQPLERLDADTPLAADHKPMIVQVISLNWKWLFLYPEQGVASVNELVTPVDVPIRFHITSEDMMNSFYIPALAGQIYSMPGMQTTMNAVMNEPGVYKGFSANYSGAGFSNMRFKYHGVSEEEFNAWVEKARENGSTLHKAEYLKLAEPSIDAPVAYFNDVGKDLYHDIVNRCVRGEQVCMDNMMMMGKGNGDMADGATNHDGKGNGDGANRGTPEEDEE